MRTFKKLKNILKSGKGSTAAVRYSVDHAESRKSAKILVKSQTFSKLFVICKMLLAVFHKMKINKFLKIWKGTNVHCTVHMYSQFFLFDHYMLYKYFASVIILTPGFFSIYFASHFFITRLVAHLFFRN